MPGNFAKLFTMRTANFRFSLKGARGLAALVLSFTVSISSIGLAVFALTNKDVMRQSDLDLIEFIYRHNLNYAIAVTFAAASLFAVFSGVYVSGKVKTYQKKAKSSSIIQVNIPDTSETVSIDLSDPSSVRDQIKKLLADASRLSK